MIDSSHIQLIADQAKEHLSPDSLLIILGPTASGKTRLAVSLAQQFNGEIISADSRQVYREMDIGTGKDLQDYQNIPYHLIDIAEPGEHYQADRFRIDFFEAYDAITSRGRLPILCGGTGSYIQSILQQSTYTQIPKNREVQTALQQLTKEELTAKIHRHVIPPDFKIDFHSHKRLVRALEILLYLQLHQPALHPLRTINSYYAIGLNPPLAHRRDAICRRLDERFQQGLVEEVQQLLHRGLSHADLHYYGLEYRYVGMHIAGDMNFAQMRVKLITEIQRFAKRQMTYFRKMEKDGITINWL